MPLSQTVFFSNKVEVLYGLLKQKIFSEEAGLFSRRLIIVPSPAVKSWLMLQLAQDPEIGIASGIEVAYLDISIARLSKMEQAPNLFELTLIIENELRQVIETEKDPLWEPLFRYLKVNKHETARKTERRVAGLAQNLANLFRDYGLFGGKMVEEWDKGLSQEWQAELWRRIYQNKLQYPSRHLKNVDFAVLTPSRETHIYLFSISYIPEISFNFLRSLSRLIPISFFHLSPCLAFWSDIKSDKESHWMLKYWQKRGMTKNQEEALEHFLRDRNPLLANFGKIGREMAEQMEESHLPVEALYALPSVLWQEPAYEDLLAHEMIAYPIEQLNALEMVQSDMVLLRNPAKTEPVVLKKEDRSIQIHSVSSKWREAQVVYDLILEYIEKHKNDKDPMRPQDVIIMAPDIMEYVPYIHAVFGSAESCLEYHVLDMSMPSQNHLVQAFLLLIDLPLTRWDALSLLQLFDYGCFQKQLNWGIKEIAQIRTWIMELNILWGEDAEHRKEMLERDYSWGNFEGTNLRTWEWGFEQLLKSVVEGGEVKISTSQLEFAGQWISLLRQLRKDLQILVNKNPFTLLEWADRLTALAEKYLGMDEQEEEHRPFLEQMTALRKAHRLLPAAQFPFTGLRKLLRQAFEKERMSFRETQLHAVRFCSMLPMRAIPAKAIVLMGMQEGAFPNQEVFSSLNMMKKNEALYAPTNVDYDRYLFLEALLSARRYFAVTYQQASEFTGKEQSPSLLITELLSYLEQACKLENGSFSKHCLIQHPFHDYDARYFEKDGPLKTYSRTSYQKACSYYLTEKKEKHQFISSYIPAILEISGEGDIKIELRHLAKLGKNPIKFYLNHALGLYFRDEEEVESEESLTLSALETAIYKREAVYNTVEAVLEQAEKKGKLPPGLFKEVARIKIKNESEELADQFKAHEITPERVFSIEFNEKYEIPSCSGPVWKMPALRIPFGEGRKVVLSGHFKEVSPRGLIVHKKRSDVSEFWPEYLVFMIVVNEFSLAIEKNLFLVKEGRLVPPFIDDPLPYFYKLIDYYRASLSAPSPLLPEVVPSMLKDEQKFSIKIEKLHEDERNYNEEWKWIYRYGTTINAEQILAEWKQRANEIYGDAVRGMS